MFKAIIFSFLLFYTLAKSNHISKYNPLRGVWGRRDGVRGNLLIGAIATSSGNKYSDQTALRINDGDKGGEMGWHSTTGGYVWIRLKMPKERYVSTVYVYARGMYM